MIEKRIFSSEKGIALILVLWIIVILGIIVTVFADQMNIELMTVKNFKDDIQADALAKLGIQKGIAILKADNNDYDYITEEWTKPCTYETGEGIAQIQISDVGSRININEADEMLLAQIPLFETQKTLDPVLDWRDVDAIPREYGAENNYYLGLRDSYPSKNAPFDSLEEIRMVKGYHNLDEKKLDKLRKQCTVWGKININIVGEDALESFLVNSGVQKDLAKQTAKNLKLYRDNPESPPFATLSPALERIAPSGSDAKYLEKKLEGMLTVTGNININTVEQDVLKALAEKCNLNSDVVQRIIVERKKNPFLRTDILGLLLPDRQSSQKFLPYFTVESSYFQINVHSKLRGSDVEKDLKAVIYRERVNRGTQKWKIKIMALE